MAVRRWNRTATNLWVVASYLMAPEEFDSAVARCVGANPELLWDLRDLAGFDHGRMVKGAPALSLGQLKALVRVAGRHFEDCRRPSGVGTGNQNAWDGSEFVHGLINQISASHEEEATHALGELAQDGALASYHDDLNHRVRDVPRAVRK
ncbi:MAG: hypothetical protein WBX25_04845 [Rhodomicrobium sp.]